MDEPSSPSFHRPINSNFLLKIVGHVLVLLGHFDYANSVSKDFDYANSVSKEIGSDSMLDQAKDPAATEAMTKLIHKYVYASRPYEKAAPPIKNGAMRLNGGAKLNLANVKKQLAWLQSEGLVPESITIDQLVDSGFVETY